MKRHDSTQIILQPQQNTSLAVRLIDLALTPVYAFIDWRERRGRIARCRKVAELFETDLSSADALLYQYYRKRVWIEDNEPGLLEDDDDKEPLLAPPQLTQEQWDELETIDPQSWKLINSLTEKPQSINTVKARAVESLIDFALAVFEDDLIDDDGVLLKGVVAPWARRGKLSAPVKEYVRSIIDQTNPPVFYTNESNLWQFNLIEYATPESARSAIDKACKSMPK